MSAASRRRSCLAPRLDFGSLGQRQSVFHIDAEAANRALGLRVAKQNLHSAQLACGLVNDRGLRPSQRMGAIILPPQGWSQARRMKLSRPVLALSGRLNRNPPPLRPVQGVMFLICSSRRTAAQGLEGCGGKEGWPMAGGRRVEPWSARRRNPRPGMGLAAWRFARARAGARVGPGPSGPSSGFGQGKARPSLERRASR